MSLNCAAFNYKFANALKSLDYIAAHNPDIVCFQEFFNVAHQSTGTRILEVLPEKLGLKYFTFVKMHSTKAPFGALICSRFPIHKSGKLNPPPEENGKNRNGTAWADITIFGESVRIYSVHLESYGFDNKDNYADLKSGSFSRIWRNINIIADTWEIQERQLEKFRANIEAYRKPAIVCADLNNPPFYKIYRTFRGDELQDTFLESGSGFGNTFSVGGYPLRLDYIFVTKDFKVADFDIFKDAGISDHYPLMARIRFRFHEKN
jgi:endonuclease/exonuclease/phosphatase family metal-dependent hydrolase